MTVYAPPTATLTIEKDEMGAMHLCALEHNHMRRLARFFDDTAVAEYKRLANQRDRYMHESGRSGL